MEAGKVIMIAGTCMFVAGLAMFYSVTSGETDSTLRFVKNTGTFVGLSGMGGAMGGVLLYLISKNEPPIKESLGA